MTHQLHIDYTANHTEGPDGYGPDAPQYCLGWYDEVEQRVVYGMLAKNEIQLDGLILEIRRGWRGKNMKVYDHRGDE